jgi:nucleoid-associated protein YejK
MTYKGLEFASSVTEDRAQFSAGSTLQLAPHISEAVKTALNNLPCFQGVEMHELMAEAEAKMGGKRKVSDRFTAMLVIAGTREITHPALQRKRNVTNIGMPQYAK